MRALNVRSQQILRRGKRERVMKGELFKNKVKYVRQLTEGRRALKPADPSAYDISSAETLTGAPVAEEAPAARCFAPAAAAVKVAPVSTESPPPITFAACCCICCVAIVR